VVRFSQLYTGACPDSREVNFQKNYFMNNDLNKLKDAIEQTNIVDDEKKVILQSLDNIHKEIQTLNFKLERASKEKNILSTLLSRTSEDLEKSSELIKKMFGRYLSTEVMNSLLEDPSALELGGEKRKVTIMMTDLRGFTALSERLKPEQVVQLINSYFEVMVDVILHYNGTVNEIIGDALLVIFGAPQEMPDRAQRAIACAIEMQNAMAKVNEGNRAQGLPELEMGIGLNETEVIVGNIGSSKRSKYAVVGSGVNMTSRIESYTVGGQILISESVRREASDILRIDAQRNVLPKGAEMPLKIYEVGGIAGHYNLALEGRDPALVTLVRQIPLRYTVLEGKDVGKKELEGSVIRLSKNCAEITLRGPINVLTNLKMNLAAVDEKLSVRDFYGKVIERPGEKGLTQLIRLTSVPPEVDAYFQAHLQHAAS
jgi:adenylate cyclase